MSVANDIVLEPLGLQAKLTKTLRSETEAQAIIDRNFDYLKHYYPEKPYCRLTGAEENQLKNTALSIAMNADAPEDTGVIDQAYHQLCIRKEVLRQFQHLKTNYPREPYCLLGTPQMTQDMLDLSARLALEKCPYGQNISMDSGIIDLGFKWFNGTSAFKNYLNNPLYGRSLLPSGFFNLKASHKKVLSEIIAEHPLRHDASDLLIYKNAYRELTIKIAAERCLHQIQKHYPNSKYAQLTPAQGNRLTYIFYNMLSTKDSGFDWNFIEQSYRQLMLEAAVNHQWYHLKNNFPNRDFCKLPPIETKGLLEYAYELAPYRANLDSSIIEDGYKKLLRIKELYQALPQSGIGLNDLNTIQQKKIVDIAYEFSVGGCHLPDAIRRAYNIFLPHKNYFSKPWIIDASDYSAPINTSIGYKINPLILGLSDREWIMTQKHLRLLSNTGNDRLITDSGLEHILQDYKIDTKLIGASAGGMAKVSFAGSYVIRQLKPNAQSEQSNFQRLFEAFNRNSPRGFQFCLPTASYTVEMNGGQRVETYILPKVQENGIGTNFENIVRSAFNGNANGKEIINLIGKKLGEFQAGSFQNHPNSPLVYSHSDLKLNNMGKINNDIVLIDAGNFKLNNPMVDLLYFVYTTTFYWGAPVYFQTKSQTITGIWRNFFRSYSEQIPQELKHYLKNVFQTRGSPYKVFQNNSNFLINNLTEEKKLFMSKVLFSIQNVFD